ncbi:hypothetical protein DFH05DRAFT_1524127 [Lentinula detonsa]|uniref:Uncharacterized protein n=1 Tax=Lentinula detonsa TaxID=2804962 RepID=A0A9W8P2U3_9AGAR|nr:hypothetical protein DFH05DRAFT_1524127 [Lentinula detonsa]
MRFAVASLYVLLGLFAVASSVPTTGSKSLAQLAFEKQTSFFAHSRYIVGDELKEVSDTEKPTVEFTFITISEGWNYPHAQSPEAVAYAKSNAFLLIQHAEETMGLKRPYIVRFTNISPASSLIAKTNGFRFSFSALNDHGKYLPLYLGRVEACNEKCKNPDASFQRTNPGITIFEGSVLQEPTQNQKNAMRKCVEYLSTAFLLPQIYFPSVRYIRGFC